MINFKNLKVVVTVFGLAYSCSLFAQDNWKHTENDRKVDEVKGTREKRIEDDNVHDYRERVQRLGGDSS